MKWSSVKWAVIATIGWTSLLFGVWCAGGIFIVTRSIADAEMQARSSRLSYGLTQALIIGWITIWVVYLLARRKRRD